MITNTTNKVMYTGDGTTIEFLVTFPFSNTSELKLYLHSISEGTNTEITSNWSYSSVTGKITYPTVEAPMGTPLSSDEQLIIIRQTPLTQEKDHDVRLFTSKDVEDMADKLTREVQDIKEQVDRSVKYSVSYSGEPVEEDEFIDIIEQYADDAIAAHNSSNTSHADIRASISNHVSNTSNPHSVTKSQVGLGDVDNTSDLNKPISTATQNALDLKQDNLTNSQLAAVNSGIDSEQVDQIGINTNAIASEIADREGADTLLQNQITSLSNNKQDNLTSIQLEAVNSGINSTKVAAIATNTSDIAAINAKIPSEASSTNKLADKTYVNDAVNSVAAYYVTSNSQGESFATKAALVAGPWYYDGSLRTPTTNDYALVVADETHDDNAARYTYTGSQWAFQYIINTTTFTQDQLNAIDSGVTAAKVSSYDSHIINTSNPHSVTKSQVGLGNVDNTSDLSKPVSTATQSALNALDAAKASNADDATIIDNGATISTVAVKEQRANAVIKKWVGTKAQYDAIATKDANTTYIVTDENDSAFLTVDSAISSNSENPVQNKVIKTALDAKQATITGGASTIASSNLTASRALVSNSSGKVAVSSVTSTELGYVAGVTSAIQTQLNSKQATLPAGTTGYFLQKTATGVAWAEVHSGGSATWGNITGTLSDQTDLQTTLNAKQAALSTGQIAATNSGITATKVSSYDTHVANTDIHVTASDKSTWNGKQSALSTTQLSATNSGITSAKVSGYDSHITNNDIHVTATQKTTWSGKQDALSTAQLNATNSGVTAAKVSGYDTHVANSDIHVTAAQKTAWSGKQDAISDLATIRRGAALGATAVQPAALTTKQDTLVSGTNIKTINGSSLLGSGNVDISSVPLFYHTFADHLFSDTSWLRADTFSWQDGSVYTSAYQHLVNDIAGKTAETETIGAITITFYRATDGHKIVLADQESNVSAIYTVTGVAWYYILDTANTRFKLPRMLPLGDTAPVIGNGNALGIIDTIRNPIDYALGRNANSQLASIYNQTSNELNGSLNGGVSGGSNSLMGVTTDPTKSGLIANLSHTSNDGAYKYLYFYVGNTVQSQTTIDVGQITETLNGKADTDLSNVSATGKSTAIGWGMPNYAAEIEVAKITSSSSFTAPSKGFLYASLYNGTAYVNGKQVAYSDNSQYSTPVLIVLNDGAVVTTTGTISRCHFYPCKGA